MEKNLFDGLAEGVGNIESEREAGIILPGFDCVDGLPGNGEPLGEASLRPVVFRAQDFDPIFQRLVIRVLG